MHRHSLLPRRQEGFSEVIIQSSKHLTFRLHYKVEIWDRKDALKKSNFMKKKSLIWTSQDHRC